MLLDAQAGMEATQITFLAMQAGSNLAHDVGLSRLRAHVLAGGDRGRRRVHRHEQAPSRRHRGGSREPCRRERSPRPARAATSWRASTRAATCARSVAAQHPQPPGARRLAGRRRPGPGGQGARQGDANCWPRTRCRRCRPTSPPRPTGSSPRSWRRRTEGEERGLAHARGDRRQQRGRPERARELPRARPDVVGSRSSPSEAGPAYSRVLLPYYLRRKLSYDGLFIRRMDYYARLRRGGPCSAPRVERVDARDARRLELADGRRLGFDRLLLATGSSPARPPIAGLEGPGRPSSLDPRRRRCGSTRCSARARASWCWAPASSRCRRPGPRGSAGSRSRWWSCVDQILPRVLDAAAARILHEQLLAHGVDVRTGTRTDGVETRSSTARCASRPPAATRSRSTSSSSATGVRPNDGLLPECSRAGRAGHPGGRDHGDRAWTACSPPAT